MGEIAIVEKGKTILKYNMAYTETPQGWVKSKKTYDPFWSKFINVMNSPELRNFKEAGVNYRVAGIEKIGGEECYLLVLNMVNKDKFKDVQIKLFKRSGVDRKEIEIMEGIEFNRWVGKWWISTNDYFSRKIETIAETVSKIDNKEIVFEIKKCTKFYDINKPVNISLPQKALDVQEMSE